MTYFEDFNHKCFLLESFFQAEDGSELKLERKTVPNEIKELPLHEFYERLKQAHEGDDLETGIPEDVQHSSLKPLLREYQKKGVKWMLSKELREETVPTHFIKIRSKFVAGQYLFYDTLSNHLFTEQPVREIMPRGGLLTGLYLTLLFNVK